MPATSGQPPAAGALHSRIEGKLIRNLQRAGKKARLKNAPQPFGRSSDGRHAHGQRRAIRWQWQKFECYFRHHTQQPFSAREEARKIEACFVFMRATAHARDRAIGQHHFQTQHIIGGDAVF